MNITNKKNKKHVHIVFLCHVLTSQVDKQNLDTFKRKIHGESVISQTLSYEIKGEEKWFMVWNMKIFKNLTTTSIWSD